MATLAIQPWGSEAKALRLRSIRVEPMMNAKSQGRGFRLRIWFSSFCTLIFSWSLIRCRLWASSIFPSRIFFTCFLFVFYVFFLAYVSFTQLSTHLFTYFHHRSTFLLSTHFVFLFVHPIALFSSTPIHQMGIFCLSVYTSFQ